MNTILGVFFEIIFLIFFALIGMAAIPGSVAKSQDEDGKVSTFLFSPMIGFAIWLAFTCCLGMFLPYDRSFLLVMLIIAGAFIYFRRENLYIPNNKDMWVFVLAVLAISIFI